MRLARSRSSPTRSPSREPYVTARGALDRREMVLLRMRDRRGLEGLGEAVPLSLRGGATLARGAELEAPAAGGLSPSRAASRRARRPPAALGAGARPRAIDVALAGPAASARPALWRLIGAELRPVPATRRSRRRSPGRSPRTVPGPRWASPPSSSRWRRRGRARSRAVRRRSAPMRGSASTPTGLGRWTARSDVAAMEPPRIELAEQPVARPRGSCAAARGDRGSARRRRERRRRARTPSGR